MTDLTVRATRPDSRTNLSSLRLPELHALAAELGMSGASKLRKGELVDAITEIQNTSKTTTDAADAGTQDASSAPATTDA
ncbi:MAG TPA: transcription termination factor Rho, partial [Microbacteriaceae bacterium]|nr:transcription termination factor Rho [Microbacteriaceae bacterium]